MIKVDIETDIQFPQRGGASFDKRTKHYKCFLGQHKGLIRPDWFPFSAALLCNTPKSLQALLGLDDEYAPLRIFLN